MKKKNKKKVENINNEAVENEVVENESQGGDNSQDTPEQKEVEKTPEETIVDLKDQLLRLAAEYQNYQKRSMKQIEQAREFAAENLVKNLLPVLDNFQHALDNGKETGDLVSIMQGVNIVFDHLLNTLTTAGMKKITVEVGGVFDPSKHEAMMHVESDDVEPNHVIMELAPGYEMNDRTLRPAKVSIAKAKVELAEETAPETEESDAEEKSEE